MIQEVELSPFFLSWHTGTKMPSCLKTRWSVHSFTDFLTRFSHNTCRFCHFHSTTSFVQGSRGQRMMGMPGPMVAVVPTCLCFPLIREQKTHFFAWKEQLQDDYDTMKMTILLHLEHKYKCFLANIIPRVAVGALQTRFQMCCCSVREFKDVPCCHGCKPVVISRLWGWWGLLFCSGPKALAWFANPVAMALLSEKTHHTSPEVPPPIWGSLHLPVLFLSFLRAFLFLLFN